MTNQPRDTLAEAIGRVAVAASRADLMLRSLIPFLGGPGAGVLADEQASASRLIEWCMKFKNQLYTLDNDLSEEFDRRAEELKRLLAKRNAVIHGLWFQDDGDRLKVSQRRTGKKGYRSEGYSVDEINRLAQDIKNAAWDFSEIGDSVAHSEGVPFPPRRGDVG